jgi:hypothetical protein
MAPMNRANHSLPMALLVTLDTSSLHHNWEEVQVVSSTHLRSDLKPITHVIVVFRRKAEALARMISTCTVQLVIAAWSAHICVTSVLPV